MRAATDSAQYNHALSALPLTPYPLIRQTTMSLHYRLATPGDIAQCIILRGQTRENAISAERLAAIGITEASWSGQVASGELPGHICQNDGQMVGFCFGSSVTGEVVVLALLPEFEARGIGQQLLQRIMATLQAHGHQRLFLGCSDNPQHRSHGFYRRLGWHSTGTRDSHGDEMLEYIFPATSEAPSAPQP
jgi:ribosomal protein S18 acetylase RimI-like enzyme